MFSTPITVCPRGSKRPTLPGCPPERSHGRVPWLLPVVASVLVVGVLGLVLFSLSRRDVDIEGKTLHVYCAAGMRLPLEEVEAQFEKEYDIDVRLEHGSSGELEGKLALENQSGNPRADVYIPADVSFVERTAAKGLTAESFPLAEFRVVVAVKPGNPANIRSLDDLFRDGIEYVLCNEEAGVGMRTMRALKSAGVWEKVAAGVKATKPRVTEAAMDIKTSADIDAGFVWHTEALKNGLDFIDIPELEGATSTVTAAVTTSSQAPTTALFFCRYLSAPGKGATAFEAHHFDTVPGDPWAEHPEIVLYSGGVNRIAVEETVDEFEKREGCEVTVKFAGCGLLVQDINAAGEKQRPDLFLTCDVSYMGKVGGFFGPASDVSSTRMVFLTRKGNPKEIHRLADLARDDVEVGIADPDKTALGDLTVQLLEDAGVRDTVTAKMVTAPSAHELRMMLEAHESKLDVAVVYEANCQGLGSDLLMLPIEHPRAQATQNIAVGQGASYPLLTGRLLDAILSARSRERFLGNGFSWIPDKQSP